MSKLLPLLAGPILCFLVVGCFGSDDSDTEPEPSASVTATVTPTRTPVPEATATPPAAPSLTPEPTATPIPRPEANAFPADLQAEALALQAQLAALRGIQDPQPVDMFLLTREQAREFYAPDEDQPSGPTPTPGPPPLDPRQELYELLGLVPEADPVTDTPTADEEALDNLIAIITGFYDPGYQAFYMIETINGGIYGLLARSTIVHELTHGLQYQAIDVNAEAGRRGGNFDATTALLSVIEGDATNSEIELLGFSTRSTLRQPVCFEIPPSRNNGTPYAIERELDVWYEDGLCFVQAIAAEGPEGIDRLFHDLPTTMEQILHPEKYLAGEGASPVAPTPLTDVLGTEWQLIRSGVFGEFGLQNILLAGLADDRVTVQAGAAGWGGDAWNLYIAGEGRLLQLETVWDTDEDASEFEATLLTALDQLGFAPTEVNGVVALDGVAWSVTLRDDSVTVLVSNVETAMETARDVLVLP